MGTGSVRGLRSQPVVHAMEKAKEIERNGTLTEDGKEVLSSETLMDPERKFETLNEKIKRILEPRPAPSKGPVVNEEDLK